MQPRPNGFTLLAIFLGIFAWARLGELFFRPSPSPGDVPGAALGLAVTVLALLSVEALWRVRPWCTRVVAAFAVLALVLDVVHLAGERPWTDAVVPLMLLAAVLAFIVRYVHGEIQSRYGPTVVLRVRRRIRWPGRP
jgi:hypothetical protein